MWELHLLDMEEDGAPPTCSLSAFRFLRLNDGTCGRNSLAPERLLRRGSERREGSIGCPKFREEEGRGT